MDKTSHLSDKDLDKIGNLLDDRLAPLAAKQDLMVTKQDLQDEIKGVETRLKAYIHEGVETIMDGIDTMSDKFAEKEKVQKLETGLKTVAAKVGVKINL